VKRNSVYHETGADGTENARHPDQVHAFGIATSGQLVICPSRLFDELKRQRLVVAPFEPNNSLVENQIGRARAGDDLLEHPGNSHIVARADNGGSRSRFDIPCPQRRGRLEILEKVATHRNDGQARQN
jgi:hypothetical protein